MKEKTKKEQVEDYLNKLIESDDFTIDNLLDLTVADLAEVPELNKIGKITISNCLSKFKHKYEDVFFNDIENGYHLNADEQVGMEIKMDFAEGKFENEEILALKKIAREHKENQNSALIELKLALKNAGIDYMMILKDYRAQKEMELLEWEESLD